MVELSDCENNVTDRFLVLSRKAEPQDLLARKYKEFQRRMSRHWLKMNEETGSSNSQEVNQRFALESMSMHSADFAGLVDANERQQQAFARAQDVQKANAHKPVFTIYKDPVGHEVDFFGGTADWRTLDTVGHQNKENDISVAKWNQSLHRPDPRSGSLVSSAVTEHAPAEPLQVFVDDEFATIQPSKSESDVTNRSCTLRQRIEGVATEEEMLAKKPLKNFGLAKEKAVHKDAPEATKKLKSSKDVKSERLGYDLEQLKTESGDVLSFEEVRARKFALRQKRHGQPAAPAQQNRFLAAGSSNAYGRQPVNSFLDTSAAVNTSVGFDEISRKLNFATSTKKVPSRHPAVLSAKMALLDQAAQEDMTINTRVAMSEVNDMFCSPERKPEVKVWDIREEDPVERKLHFSVFDDSVESVAPSTHDQSIREDPHVPIAKQSFSIFSDDAPAPPPTDSKAKGQQRKPLGSRDDLLRSVRLTNKDALMQLRNDKTEESPASPRDKR